MYGKEIEQGCGWGGGVGDAADGPSRKIKVLRRNGMGVGGGVGMLVKERKHNTSKYSKYWVGDSSVLEKFCKKYQKLGGWSDDTGKNLQKFSKMGRVGCFGVLADFFSIRSAEHAVWEDDGINGEYERDYINATGTGVSEMADGDDEQYVYRDGFYKLVNIDSTPDKENARLQAKNVPANAIDYKTLYEECKRQSTELRENFQKNMIQVTTE